MWFSSGTFVQHVQGWRFNFRWAEYAGWVWGKIWTILYTHCEIPVFFLANTGPNTSFLRMWDSVFWLLMVGLLDRASAFWVRVLLGLRDSVWGLLEWCLSETVTLYPLTLKVTLMSYSNASPLCEFGEVAKHMVQVSGSELFCFRLKSS